MDQNKYTIALTVKDHSVSKQTFGLYHDSKLDLLITFPKPDKKELPAYYESEDYISHTDGNRSLFEKAYHYIKKRTIKSKINLINVLHPEKGHILDIGAGTGDFMFAAKLEGWTATGIEPSEKARTIALQKGVGFAESTIHLSDQSFDVISMWHVLEHIPDLDFQFIHLKRLIKPNGTLIIAVPNFHSYDAKYYGSFWAAYDVPRHLWHFSKTAIKKLFAEKGMVLINILPMRFDAFYVALLSEKYKRGYMNFFMAFIIGLKSNAKAKRNLEYSSHIYILKTNKNQNRTI